MPVSSVVLNTYLWKDRRRDVKKEGGREKRKPTMCLLEKRFLFHSKEKPLGAGWGGMLGVDEEAGLFRLISKWE